MALILLILTASCSNHQNTLNNYVNYPVKVAKQKIEYPNGDFSFSIPINWEWEVENYEIENNYLFSALFAIYLTLCAI